MQRERRQGRDGGREGAEGGKLTKSARRDFVGIPCDRCRRNKMGRGVEGGRAAKESDEKGPKRRHSMWEGSKKSKNMQRERR